MTGLGQIFRLRFRDPEIKSELWGPGHLWFLEYLLLMLLAYGLVRWWSDARKPTPLPLRKWFHALLGSPWQPLVLAVPTTALLWFSRQRLGIDAVLDRHNSFFPDPVKFLHHAAFFVVGAGLYRLRHDLLPRLARVGPAYLALAAPINQPIAPGRIGDDDIVGDREIGDQRQFLKDAGYSRRIGLRRRGETDLLAPEVHRPFVRLDDAGDDLDEGRLAGAVLAQYGVNSAGLDHEIGLLQSTNTAIALGDPLQA